MNFKLMMTLRSKYNQGLRTKETLEAKASITNRDKEQGR